MTSRRGFRRHSSAFRTGRLTGSFFKPPAPKTTRHSYHLSFPVSWVETLPEFPAMSSQPAIEAPCIYESLCVIRNERKTHYYLKLSALIAEQLGTSEISVWQSPNEASLSFKYCFVPGCEMVPRTRKGINDHFRKRHVRFDFAIALKIVEKARACIQIRTRNAQFQDELQGQNSLNSLYLSHKTPIVENKVLTH